MLVALGVVVSLAAAARSTWSPCGASMLSTLTPLGERARGGRFATTAWWFVVGATLGGAALGAVGAGFGALMRLAAPGTGTAALDIAAAGALGAAGLADLALARRGPLGHGRQVNERWLDQFRPWVYGAGFGAQIGAGLATYVTTAGVYLVLLLGALAGSPPVALGLGVLFGLVRGLAVLSGRAVVTPEALRRLHARFDALDAPSRRAMVVVELAAAPLALAGGWSASGPSARGGGPVAVAVLVAVVIVAVGLAAAVRAGRGVSRRPSPSPSGSSGA